MAGRHLSAAEAALWARVMATVRPIAPERPVAPFALPPLPAAPEPPPPQKRMRGRVPAPAVPRPVGVTAPTRPTPGTTLDASWDRKLARGRVDPDRIVDLHGHTLHSAHDLLDHALEQAIGHGERVILLVTGKPPRPDSERPHRRGAIRASVGDWLAGSRHARHIAAVRGAGPGHGGQGALYIVLRRARERADT